MTSEIDQELEKLRIRSVRRGHGDGSFDGRGHPGIRQAIIDASPIPIAPCRSMNADAA